MPTPTGKPKVGERVRFHHKEDGSGNETTDATVVRRVDGSLWSIEVLVDGERRNRIIGEAQWMLDHKYMEVLG